MKIYMGTDTRVAAFNCPNCGAAVAPDKPSCNYCGSSIAALVCPACFGAVAIGMRHCPHCGAVAANSEPPKTGLRRCPRCETNLQQQAVGKSTMNICRKCGGLWVNKDTFQAICTREEEQESVLDFKPEALPTASQENSKKPQRAYIPCPECGKLMNHKNFSGSGVVLDWCRQHGSWFDRNELQNIVRFIREGGLRKARERQELKLKERQDDLRMQERRMYALEQRFETGITRMEADRGETILSFLSKMF